MLHKMLKTIKQHDMVTQGEHIAVGLSGGADSVALLFLLLSAQAELGVRISAVHVNHGIRGEQANRDELFVRRLCETLSVDLRVFAVDAPQIARARRQTLEEAARDARYAVFAETEADKIAVAHHKNDNAETVLMRLIRGAGVRGLAGIPPKRGRIIRPLIDRTKSEIEVYCAENGLSFQLDLTNLDDVYTRNGVRLNALPLIENTLNPSVVDALARTAALCREDADWLDMLAREALENCKAAQGNALRVDALTALHAALRRRVIRLALLPFFRYLQDVSYEHIQSIDALLHKGTGKTVHLPQNVIVKTEYGLLLLTQSLLTQSAPQKNGFCYDLLPDKPVYVREMGKTVLLTKANMKKKTEKQTQNMYTKPFFCATIENGLQLRSRQPGDRIVIHSMGGRKKLKDYFIDRKVPRQVRDTVPLLASGSDILWILDDKGIVSDAAKATEANAHTITICIREGKYDLE